MYNYSNKKICNNVYIPEFTYELVSYIVSKKGAEKLLTLFPKINYHVDVSIFKKYKDLNIYSVKTPIFKQQSTNSNNIEGALTHSNNPLSHIDLLYRTTFLKIHKFHLNIMNTTTIFLTVATICIIFKKKKLFLYIAVIIIISILLLFRRML